MTYPHFFSEFGAKKGEAFPMQFFLFRHADKERTFTADPPLSPRGFRQALALAELVKNDVLVKPTVLLSSPKNRAIQTFQPLAAHLNLRLQITPDLLERQNTESSEAFMSRIKNVISRAEKQTGISGVIFAVTHYDWIEDFLSLVPSDMDFNESSLHSWPPAHYMDFEIKEGLWNLRQFKGVSP